MPASRRKAQDAIIVAAFGFRTQRGHGRRGHVNYFEVQIAIAQYYAGHLRYN